MQNADESKYHHPYEPYEVQKQLMSAVYECIEQAKVGIFESPTDHKRQVYGNGFAAKDGDDSEPDWMIEHARKEKKEIALRHRDDLEHRLALIREREAKAKLRNQIGQPPHKRQRADIGSSSKDNDEEQFILDDYDSDDQGKTRLTRSSPYDYGFSAETQKLMAKLGMNVISNRDEDNVEAPDELKIFYGSRTHSQLTQFADELRKVKLPPGLHSVPSDQNLPVELVEAIKHLTLGSRKNLCINPKVAKLGNATAINESCLELQQSKTPSDLKCQFLPSKETESLANDFRDHALAKIQDIEELASLGKRFGICPYYASRHAIRPAEIVTLPYPLLLQKSARDSLGISLKDHVVIIDEAHNIMDAISGIYSISVSLSQLQLARAQLGMYLQKFRNRLKGKNRVYLAQIVRLLDSIIAYLQEKSKAQGSEGIAQPGDLMSGKGVDQINLFKLIQYLQESKLARKVDGYTIHVEEQRGVLNQNKADNQRRQIANKTTPVLTHIQFFLLALMNPSAEGRFIYLQDVEQGMSIRYMLLDPTHHFKDIVEEARAVILAGGTMSPMEDYKEHLLSYLPKEKITTLSCGHVIASDNLLAVPVVRGPSGIDFEFNFEKRNSEVTIEDLGKAFISILPKIPDGVVVFFPSYAYVEKCISQWQRKPTGTSPASIWTRLSALKPIFYEIKSGRDGQSNKADVSETDSILSAYSNAVAASENHRGALLLSVVGGSLSEGINFSDSLGRCVIVVGLPFPNPHSPEWKAKLSYITNKSGGPKGKNAAREFYENACMRSVNQSIGRAIRHKNDYAAILIIDKRYNGDRIKKKLPTWIGSSLKQGMDVGQTAEAVGRFFENKSHGEGLSVTARIIR